MSLAVNSSPLYAAIDLGSNSFHMLVVRHIDGSIQTMAKIKRKVRLAAGLMMRWPQSRSDAAWLGLP